MTLFQLYFLHFRRENSYYLNFFMSRQKTVFCRDETVQKQLDYSTITKKSENAMVFKARSKQAAPPTRKTLRRGRPHDSGGGLVETSPKDRSRRDSGRTIPTKD